MYAITVKASTIEDGLERRVGRAIKLRREAQGLALRALAAMSGVSASMISDIERGAKSPTISTLSLLARALAVPISTLIEAEPMARRIHVIRGAERRRVADPASGATHERLAALSADTRLEFLRYCVPPHAAAGPFAAHAAGTIEHMHVAQGALRLVCGEEEARLEAGDSCSCLADAPHLFDNSEGAAEAQIYLVIDRRSPRERDAP